MVVVDVPGEVGLVLGEVSALAAPWVLPERLLVPPVERGEGHAQQLGRPLHVDVLVGNGLKNVTLIPSKLSHPYS